MQMTHAEAHQLIQYDLDRALPADQREPLLAHLEKCEACRAYADGMRDMENVLRVAMQKKWNHAPLPLSIASLKSRQIFKSSNSLFGLQTTLVSVVLVFFSFFIWELTASISGSSGKTFLTVNPVPTPSIQLSTTSPESAECESTVYKVKSLDTLESIAVRYSVSKEKLMNLNNLTSEMIYESMELKIPKCTATPTTTAGMPTTTLTPILELTIRTPG
jgi:hypothetical protein